MRSFVLVPSHQACTAVVPMAPCYSRLALQVYYKFWLALMVEAKELKQLGSTLVGD